MKYVCKVCGYQYNEEVKGVNFDELTDDWACPVCGVSKDEFEPD